MKNSYIGIDGCKFGWIVIEILDELNFNFELINNISAVEQYTNVEILIDIPIGLGDKYIERNLDLEARKLLTSAKKSSIFTAPCRDAVYAKNYEHAKIINKNITGKSISIQAWNICNKIKEVDQFLMTHSNKKSFFREAHPEICFTLLNDNVSLLSKKSTPYGHIERLDLLKKNYLNAEKIYHTIEENTLRKFAKKDDILDAMVLAICSFKYRNIQPSILKNKPLKDSMGIEIGLWMGDFI